MYNPSQFQNVDDYFNVLIVILSTDWNTTKTKRKHMVDLI